MTSRSSYVQKVDSYGRATRCEVILHQQFRSFHPCEVRTKSDGGGFIVASNALDSLLCYGGPRISAVTKTDMESLVS